MGKIKWHKDTGKMLGKEKGQEGAVIESRGSEDVARSEEFRTEGTK